MRALWRRSGRAVNANTPRATHSRVPYDTELPKPPANLLRCRRLISHKDAQCPY